MSCGFPAECPLTLWACVCVCVVCAHLQSFFLLELFYFYLTSLLPLQACRRVPKEQTGTDELPTPSVFLFTSYQAHFSRVPTFHFSSFTRGLGHSAISKLNIALLVTLRWFLLCYTFTTVKGDRIFFFYSKQETNVSQCHSLNHLQWYNITILSHQSSSIIPLKIELVWQRVPSTDTNRKVTFIILTIAVWRCSVWQRSDSLKPVFKACRRRRTHKDLDFSVSFPPSLFS